MFGLGILLRNRTIGKLLKIENACISPEHSFLLLDVKEPGYMLIPFFIYIAFHRFPGILHPPNRINTADPKKTAAGQAVLIVPVGSHLSPFLFQRKCRYNGGVVFAADSFSSAPHFGSCHTEAITGSRHPPK